MGSWQLNTWYLLLSLFLAGDLCQLLTWWLEAKRKDNRWQTIDRAGSSPQGRAVVKFGPVLFFKELH